MVQTARRIPEEQLAAPSPAMQAVPRVQVREGVEQATRQAQANAETAFLSFMGRFMENPSCAAAARDLQLGDMYRRVQVSRRAEG